MSYLAEQSAIGAMLIDAACVPSAIKALRVDDFESRPCRELFAAIREMYESGNAIDLVTVNAQTRGAFEKFILECCELTPTAANADEYFSTVKRDSRARRIEAAGHKIAYGDYESVGAVIDNLITISDEDDGGDIVGGEDWAKAFHAEQLDIIADPSSAFCRSGYQALDKILGGGFFNGGLYVVGARPGMGKTTFAINIAEKFVRRGDSVLFISLEMTTRQLMCKRIAIEGVVPYRHLLSGVMSTDEQVAMEEALHRISHRPFFVNKKFGLTVEDISVLARHCRGCRAVIVDYFGLITVDGDGRGRYEDYTTISGRLKQLACRLNVPILCLAQLNRESVKREDKRPQLADLRDTGAIEQDADGVIFLHRQSYFARGEKPTEEDIDIIVAKNRHGETGTATLRWSSEFGGIAEKGGREF